MLVNSATMYHKSVETFHITREYKTGIYFLKCLVHMLAQWPMVFLDHLNAIHGNDFASNK